MFKLVGISKNYNETKVLSNINYTFKETGFVSIFGKSGSGKSTLLNIISLLLKPTSGSLYYKNKDVRDLKLSEIEYIRTNEIGFLFQHYNLFEELTVEQNLLIPQYIKGTSQKKSKEKINSYLSKYGLTKLKNKKVFLLSGGEKQRISFIRSIINDQEIILADEPTGALDTKNSEIIMQDLKSLSKTKLIINVSHNLELSEKYSDEIIHIRDGEIITTKPCKNTIKNNYKKNKNNNKNFSWKIFFQKLFAKKHLIRNIALILTTSFSFGFIQIFAGFYSNSSRAIETAQTQTLSYNYFTVSQNETIQIDNSNLTLNRVSRPTFREVEILKESIPSIKIDYNYSSIIPNFPTFIFENKNYENIEFLPVLDMTNIGIKNILIKGNLPQNNSISSVIVNKEFLKATNSNIEKIIDKKIQFSFSSQALYKRENLTNPIKDEISFTNTFSIKGVVEEFSYMNTPKVYFSNQAILDYLDEIILENSSHYLNRNYTALDLIADAKNDDPFSGYCLNCFVKDIEDMKKVFSYIESNEQSQNFLELTSESFITISSFNNLTTLFESSMIIFVIIAIIGTILIIGIISFSCFIEEKKSSAILTCLGARKSSIVSLYTNESMLFSLIGAILSFPFGLLFKLIFNSNLSNFFGIKEMIVIPYSSFLNIPFLLPLILIFGSLLIAFLSSFFPINLYKKFSVIEELKDE